MEVFMFNCKYCEYSFKCGKKIQCSLYDNQDVSGVKLEARYCVLEPLEHVVRRLSKYVHHFPEGTCIKDLKLDRRAYITLMDLRGTKQVIRVLDALKRYGDALVLKKTYEAYHIELL